MKLGIATYGTPIRVKRPDYIALWYRLPWHFSELPMQGTLADIRARGAVPFVYFESSIREEGWSNYDRILQGDFDPQLRELAQALSRPERVYVRIDQEVNGRLGFPWQADKAFYVPAFQRIADILHTHAPNVRTVYSPGGVGGRKVDELTRYYPGDVADAVGFTRYSWREDGRWPPTQWRATIRHFQDIAPGKEIICTETGRLRGLSRRKAWLRSISKVEGLDGAIYFDVDMGKDEADVAGMPRDWRMGRGMVRAFDRMTCG